MSVLLDSVQQPPLSAEDTTDSGGFDRDDYLLQLVRDNQLATIADIFGNPEHARHSELLGDMDYMDREGKKPVDLAVCLGHADILQELHKRGASITNATSAGYTPLHRAAAWNRLSCVRYLVQNDANIHAKTRHGEKPRDIAGRYGHHECAWYLEWAEVKQDLIRYLKDMRDTVLEPERILGRLTKDDKNQTLAVCQEKLEWAEGQAQDTTMEEIREKRREIENFLEHVVHKLNEPPVEKTHKK